MGYDVLNSAAIDLSGRVYIGSADNVFYALTSAGACSWSYRASKDIVSSAARAFEGRVYVGAQNNALYAFNSNGTLLGSYVGGGSFNS